MQNCFYLKNDDIKDTLLFDYQNDTINNNLNFISWCKQFVNETCNFIEISDIDNLDSGLFSIIMSKDCNKVYAFLLNNTNLEKNITKNNISNINVIDNPDKNTIEDCINNDCINNDCIIDDYNIIDTYFLKINSDNNHINILKGASNTLINSNYPPFIFNIDKTKVEYNSILFEYIKSLGYKIVNILNVDDYILASDNHIRFLDETDITIKLYDKYLNSANLNSHNLDSHKWFKLAKKLMEKKYYDKAYECLNNALINPLNIERKLSIYQNIAQIAIYIDKKVEGLNACENILLSSYNNTSFKNNILLLYSKYMKRLPFKKILQLFTDINDNNINNNINNNNNDEFKESSPSIIKYQNGYKCNIRYVNYSISNTGQYIMKDNIVRTRNKLLTLDTNLNIKDNIELINNTKLKQYDSNIKGLEDIRLFTNNIDKQLSRVFGNPVRSDKSFDKSCDKSHDIGHFICTSLEFNSKNTPQMCYGQYDLTTGNINKIIPMKINSELKCEKNWIPLMVNNEIYFIYSIYPFRLYHFNNNTNETSLIKEGCLTNETKSCLSEFRGSSPLIPYKNGWLGTIHQVYYNNPRKYFHRFIWFDLEFTTIKYSKLFYFESINIEFNLSICHSNDGLLMTYSQNDNTGKIGLIDYNIVDEYLHNPTKLY